MHLLTTAPLQHLILIGFHIFSYHRIFISAYFVTEDGVVTSKLSDSLIPILFVYDKNLTENIRHSELIQK